MRKLKFMVLAVLATCAVAVPAAASAAGGNAPAVTAGGIKVKPCDGPDYAPLLVNVRGVDCKEALDLANEGTSEDDPCPEGWNTRHVVLKAVADGESIEGPNVYLCARKSGQTAFTYKPFVG
jgi:hypothetical protein